MEHIIDRVIRVAGAAGREYSVRDLRLSDGEELCHSYRVSPYTTSSFIFVCWLLQFTIHVHVLCCIFSFGKRIPGLGRINTAAVVLAGTLFDAGTDLNLTNCRLFAGSGADRLEIPFDRLLGVDPQTGWIANTLTIHFRNLQGVEAKIKLWALEPDEIAAQIQALSKRRTAQSDSNQESTSGKRNRNEQN